MIAEAVRFLVYGFACSLCALAVGTTALGQIYDGTQLCQKRSLVALSGCRQGSEPLTRDPLGRWHLHRLGEGAADPQSP